MLALSAIAKPPLVARGSGAPLVGDPVHATDLHGNDGLGGWTFCCERASKRENTAKMSARPAAEAILQSARQRPGGVTLLQTGPATNAALALRQDPGCFSGLRGIVMMAGAVWEPGNMTATAEFNVYSDPESTQEVLRSRVPVTLVGLDVTRKVALTRELVEFELAGRNDERAQFLRCICNQGFAFNKGALGWEGMYLHDPLAAAVAIDRSLVEIRRMKVDVETQGELTRGMLVAERRAWKTGGENARVAMGVDAERFMRLFMERVFRPVN